MAPLARCFPCRAKSGLTNDSCELPLCLVSFFPFPFFLGVFNKCHADT